MKEHNFQVNLEGIIDILSNHLYSEEKVFIRELLQNATDAIVARTQIEPSFNAEIQIELIAPEMDMPAQIIFEDNGIGLTMEEVHAFLSSIGSSSKRGALQQRRKNFIGQFGIGLLSCFMVTNEIIMITKSIKSERAIEWRGRADGSYTYKELEGDYESGTKIFIQAKEGKETYFEQEKLFETLHLYGSLLPYPVKLLSGSEKIEVNAVRAPWEVYYEDEELERQSILDYGKVNFGVEFNDYIMLLTPDGDTQGVAYILPYEVSPSAKITHKVYLKHMLISEKADNLLPDWAFFVKCIINTDALRPTASREAFYEDKQLRKTRNELGDLLKEYLISLEENAPEKLKSLYVLHYHSMNTLALHDDEFFNIIIPYVPFETDRGNLTLPEFEKISDEIRHIPDVDEFRQIAGIASAQGIPIINSGYTYKRELLEKLEELQKDKRITQVNTEHFIERFKEPLPSEKEQATYFMRIADSVLQEYKCQAILKKFDPANLATLYSKDEFTSFLNSMKNSKEDSTLWGGIMNELAKNEFISGYSKLCFNLENSVVKKLIVLSDEEKLSLYVKIMYVQSLLLGHHPLQQEDLNILSEGLTQLIDFGME